MKQEPKFKKGERVKTEFTMDEVLIITEIIKVGNSYRYKFIGSPLTLQEECIKSLKQD